jgi:putative Mn2+ efflux pump MntP
LPFVFEVLALGLVLSVDSFSAAVAMGGRRFSTSDLLKFACASGGAEAVATLIGHVAGARFIAQISAYDHWVAFGCLASVSLHMAFDGIRSLRGPRSDLDAERFHSLSKILLVSLATSMDAFGVGIGLGVADRPVWPFVGSIAFFAFALTILGMYVGRRVSKQIGPLFTLLAALVLGYLSIEMLKI